MTDSPVTHYSSRPGFHLYCLDPQCRPADAEPETCSADDYHDEDCNGGSLTCEVCDDPIFPEAFAEHEADQEYWMRYARSAMKSGRNREARLARLQADDPVAFYISCKDNPDAIEAALEEQR